jgi:hypothetical protein
VSTPRSRARGVRGALVGAASAGTAVGAHAAAGGGVPHGPALAIALLMCATVGALFGTWRLEGRVTASTAWMATTAALCAAQLLGHLTLAVAGHHHGELFGASMAVAHLGAAIVLGGAIAAVEYLYVVCSSVLCWLRLFVLRAPRPTARVVRRTTNIVVPRPYLTSVLGMRAPPRFFATA